METVGKLGEILVEQGLLSTVTVERVVAMAGRLGKRFGVVLEEMGLVTEEEMARALARQYQLRPVFNFAAAAFGQETLAALTSEVALANHFFPLKLDRERLALAVADPSEMRIVRNMAINSGLTVIPYVATRSEIKAAICRHYLGKEPVEPLKQTVLIVEDDQAVLAMLEEVLSRQYRVITAADGLDAYREVVSKKPHVVLTDKEMPKLNGFALLGALQSTAETKKIPVILVSGVDGEHAETEAFKKGFFDFIPKPISEATLLNRVQRAYQFSQSQSYLFLR